MRSQDITDAFLRRMSVAMRMGHYTQAEYAKLYGLSKLMLRKRYREWCRRNGVPLGRVGMKTGSDDSKQCFVQHHNDNDEDQIDLSTTAVAALAY